MIELLSQNWSVIVLMIVCLGGLLYLYKEGKRETVRKIILSLVVQAEQKLGSSTGELKYAMVVEGLYTLLPPLLKILLTKAELDKMIEEAVKYLKDYLDDSRNLLPYEEEYRKLIYDNYQL